MANMIDYLNWRGDLSLNNVPMNAVDALILSTFIYMPLDELVSPEWDPVGVTMADVIEQLIARNCQSTVLVPSPKEDRQLLEAIGSSARFQNMRLTAYVNRIDLKKEEQFCAVTFLMPNNEAVIAFRGTDASMVGWKEDFNMSYAEKVPAQETGRAYAMGIAEQTSCPLTICGHSKGGNIAVYAGVFAPPSVQERIRCVYNFDGPGFNENVVSSPQFCAAGPRVHTFIPQSSVVGILLWHAEPFTVVRSNGIGVLQHVTYSWQVMGGEFLTVSERTRDSHLAEETMKRWLSSLSNEERRNFIEGVYAVLQGSDGKNVKDLFDVRNIAAILRAIGGMGNKQKEEIGAVFLRLGNSIWTSLPELLDPGHLEKTEKTE